MLEQVGRYKVERELGRGGMGIVYLAEDPVLHRQVAIKTINLGATRLDSESLRNQLLRDARAAAALSHPNIVSVYDVVEVDDALYLVLEYIAGETLLDRMRRQLSMDLTFVVPVLRDMAAALDYTHSRGIIHRDIKPANVMIDSSGRARIMDFGIARISDQRTAATQGWLFGTIQYMSPEQIKGEALDERTDQFSLAAVAYELLTGHLLFESNSLTTLAYKIVHEAPPPANVRNPALPQAVGTALAKALDRDPACRYPTCTAFLNVLAAACEGRSDVVMNSPGEAPTVALTGVRPETAPVKPRNRIAPMVIVAGLVVACIAAAFLLLRQPRPAPPVTLPATLEPVPAPPPKKAVRAVKAARSEPVKAPEPVPEPIADIPEETAPAALLPPRMEQILNAPQDGPGKRAYDAGKSAMQSHDYGASQRYFTEAINLKPDSIAAYFLRGVAYFEDRRPKLAADDFTKVIELRPKYAPGWNRLGNAMGAQHRDQEALDDYRRSWELAPKIARPHVSAGLILNHQGRSKEAIEQFDKAIELSPNYVQAYRGRANAKRKLGDPGAQADFDKVKELRAHKAAEEP